MLKGGQCGWPITKWDQRGYKGLSDIDLINYGKEYGYVKRKYQHKNHKRYLEVNTEAW